MEKVIIFSHESDIDGLGNIILGKLAYGEIDYVLVSNVNILEAKFNDYLDKGLLHNYDRVFITDLSLHGASLEAVSNDFELSEKVHVFDHHKSAISEGLDGYSFTTVIETDETGKKRCGTDLFYEYLCSTGLLARTKALDEFVELTRLEDTWLWKASGEQGIKAHDLATLLNVIGIDDYIESIFNKLKAHEDSFEYTEEEKRIIEETKAEYLATLQRLWSEAEILVDENENKYAGVFADYEYRNELSEYVRSIAFDDLKYLVIIALEKGEFGQKSYRSIPADFDVGKIAEEHGGGGQFAAASVNITKEQREKGLVLRKTNPRESIKYLVDSTYK